MNAMNPYAPPQMSHGHLAPQALAAAWRREGDLLVVPKGAMLPNVCIYTGQPAAERVQRKLQWAPQWLGVIVAISPLIYLILYFILRKTGEINYAVSEEAKKRRTTGILVGVGGTLASIALCVLGGAADVPALLIIGALGFFVTLIAGILMANLYRVSKIDEQFIYLKLKPAALDVLAR